MSGILLGGAYRDLLEAPLRALGLAPVWLPDHPAVDPRLRGHADLAMTLAGERAWLAPHLRETEIPHILQNSGVSVAYSAVSLSNCYPKDAALNLCIMEQHLIFAPDVHAKEIVETLTIQEGRIPIPVRQGYANCVCCVVDRESLITADRGVSRACEAAGLQVLTISPGHVELSGFAYGFLGGASFFLAPGRLAFTGTLDKHPERKQILDFLERRRVEPIFLTQQPVFDIGGAFVFP